MFSFVVCCRLHNFTADKLQQATVNCGHWEFESKSQDSRRLEQLKMCFTLDNLYIYHTSLFALSIQRFSWWTDKSKWILRPCRLMSILSWRSYCQKAKCLLWLGVWMAQNLWVNSSWTTQHFSLPAVLRVTVKPSEHVFVNPFYVFQMSNHNALKFLLTCQSSIPLRHLATLHCIYNKSKTQTRMICRRLIAPGRSHVGVLVLVPWGPHRTAADPLVKDCWVK